MLLNSTPSPESSFGTQRMLLAKAALCGVTTTAISDVKGIYPAPDIHEQFMIHKGYGKTAYIFTHNFNNLEHIATNCMNTTMHTDANIAQF